ncbi:MAG: PqqD family protein [bacterium]
MSHPIRFEPSADVLVSHLEGEAILLHMGTKEYFRLNRVGAQVWKLLDGGSHPDGIVDQLVTTFEVSRSEATDAVGALLQELRNATLIREALA